MNTDSQHDIQFFILCHSVDLHVLFYRECTHISESQKVGVGRGACIRKCGRKESDDCVFEFSLLPLDSSFYLLPSLHPRILSLPPRSRDLPTHVPGPVLRSMDLANNYQMNILPPCVGRLSFSLTLFYNGMSSRVLVSLQYA